jgi:hypothetical protein
MPNAPAPVDLTGSAIVTAAEKLLGDPYKYGATGPSSFDCSGLVQFVFKGLGISVPRTSEEQFTAGKAVSESQLQAGDLVFSAGSDGTASHPGHVGIYVGEHNGAPSVLEAPHTGADVRYTPLSSFDAVGYRRMNGVAAGGSATDAGFTIPGLGDVGGLLNFPSDITGFFSDATDDLASAAKFFGAFTRVSTWVRIGSGALGAVALVAGLVMLILAAGERS